MEIIARKITGLIITNNLNLTDLEIKKIEFGLTCIISELSKIFMFLIIFSVFSVTDYFLVGLAFFCSLRLVAGGYHDKTYWRCFATSLTIFTIIALTSSYIHLSTIQRLILLLISFILVWRYAPVDHPNKPIISNIRRKKLRVLAVFLCIFFGVLSFLLRNDLSVAAVTAIFLEGLTLPLGVITKRGLENENFKR
ncbi:accessory gene regulator B [Anaerosolibacter carboniphilus]|uniref:Accessory gene regulator B n=1 Tax=Anaerosolibacter carboniphilus TaxID=1417629 RepID=A0A841KUU6_9FIRM|nr:accessory gene regulator B family protein [Anaerosolibacter carboniphilus]MBB6217143.1 accessory gene regulator B [Anaerosolibacter carboniphilus]